MPSASAQANYSVEPLHRPAERRQFRPSRVNGKSITLHFGAEVSAVVRARMSYAFRVFAAVYGHRIDPGNRGGEISCFYGDRQKAAEGAHQFFISPSYRVRPPGESLPAFKKVRYAGEEIILLHGVTETSGEPDWLGELFEWLSGSLELPVTKRDEVGRIPYSEMVFGKQEISSLRPHAALLMAWFENAMRNGGKPERLPRPPSPVESVEHMVVCSHDIDFYFTNRASVLTRLGKNLGIAASLYQSPSFFASNLKLIWQTLMGKHVGEYIPEMLRLSEAAGFRSTLFAVAGGTHRRDPNYKIAQIARQLRDAAKRGFSVGLHGSYQSMVENGTLGPESQQLTASSGGWVRGNRQHWLRFGDQAKLCAVLEDTGMIYDSSLGFAERCGFRNGANFAFPPYNFIKERPCDFLEIPLVIMDGSLQRMTLGRRDNPQQIADELLAQSRKWGWGGISVLWHNPVEAIQVPERINQVFWSCARKRKEHAEEWMSADEFMLHSLQRYQSAGLLQEVRLRA